MRYFTKVISALLCFCMLATGVIAADIGTVNVDVLNVREEKSLDSAVVDQLFLYEPVSVYAKDNGWYTIQMNGKEVYVVADYVTLQFLDDGVTRLYAEPKFGVVCTDSLRVRAAASFESEVLRSVYNGARLELIGESGLFYAIQDNVGAIQFVAKEYVNEITYEEYQATAAGNNVVEAAMAYIGTPYRYGGSSPRGFDCSGFTSYVYGQMGVSLNRTAAGQLSNGTYVALEDMQPGDLVFFANGNYVNHVGIYIGGGNMVHAPYAGKTVCVESIYNGYFAPRLYGARRIF